MTAVVEYASLLCVAAGLVVAVLVLGQAGDARLALVAALDFWLAAGLLRLGQAPGWPTLVATAVIMVIRQVVGRTWRRPAMPGADVPGRRQQPNDER